MPGSYTDSTCVRMPYPSMNKVAGSGLHGGMGMPLAVRIPCVASDSR